MFHGLPYPESPHFTAFTHAALDDAYRNEEVFASSANAVDPEGELGFESTMLSMGGAQHRRYRALVQPSFVPAKAQWWITNWIGGLVEALVDGIVAEGRAELNVDFCAPIPVMTITGSFGISVERALDVRESMGDPMKIIEMLTPIIEARRAEPSDDLISVLVESEITDEDGVSHRLSDAEIHSFALLLLAAGSGTTWKQMGIALAASARAARCARRGPRRPDFAEGGHRGESPMDADRPDVLAMGHPRHRLPRNPRSEGCSDASLPRRGQSRSGSMGGPPR